MADPTASITTALADMVSAQLDAVETASSNPIKTVYNGELYNSLIIDPGMSFENGSWRCRVIGLLQVLSKGKAVAQVPSGASTSHTILVLVE